MPNDGFIVDGESIKPVSSRNVEPLDNQYKPAIVEDPEEESKSDRGLQ